MPRTLVPPLRADLTWDVAGEGEDAVFRLVDARLGRTLRIDRRGREVALMLDRPQTAEALGGRIASTGRPMAADALDRVIAAFEGLGLLETESVEAEADAAADARDRLREDPASVPLLIPDDLRFSCSACGSCCLGVNVGPIGGDVAKAIEAERARVSGSPLPPRGLFFSMVPEGDDARVVVCQSRNGACVFLEPDGLCRVHRTMGPASKPRVCRLFPIQFASTPRGVAVEFQLECRDILRASRGEPVREAEVRELLSVAGQIHTVRPFVSLDGEIAFGFDEFEAVEASVLEAVAGTADGGFGPVLAALRVVAARCAGAGRPFPATVPEVADLRLRAGAFVGELSDSLGRLREGHSVESDRVLLDTSNLDLTVECLAAAPFLLDEVLSPDDDAEAGRFARMVVVNLWRSKEILSYRDLVTGTAMLGLRWFLTRCLATHRARQVNRRTALAQDLVDAHVVVSLMSRGRRVRTALDRLVAPIVDLFAHDLDDLVRLRRDVVSVEPRTEFHVF